MDLPSHKAILFLHHPSNVSAFRDITTLSFDDGFKPLFRDVNLVRPDDGNARILHDRFTGAGFITSDMYQLGFFSVKIKLPSAYTAGVVVAFYVIPLIGFYVDEVPIREVVPNDDMGGEYPSKPMSLY